MRVQIYTPTHICIGHVHCPDQRRLLDVLNGLLRGTLHTNTEFLPMSTVDMRFTDGRELTLQSAYINKANILFVREIESHQTMAPGGEVGHKPYPFVPKRSAEVTLYMPLYTLTGRMHCAKGKRVWDVLNSGLRFLPLTNVEISHSAGGSESGVTFIAVNKGQILFLEELGEFHRK